MFATKVVEKIKTHISCSVTSFSPESRAVSENVGKFGRPRLSIDDSTSIIRFMRIACWMTETRLHDTHTWYWILTAFPRQQWLRERACVTLCVHCLCCLQIKPYSLTFLSLYQPFKCPHIVFRLFCKTSIPFTGYGTGFIFVVVSTYHKKPTIQGAAVSK